MLQVRLVAASLELTLQLEVVETVSTTECCHACAPVGHVFCICPDSSAAHVRVVDCLENG